MKFTVQFTSVFYPLAAGVTYTGSATFYLEIPEDFTGIPLCVCKIISIRNFDFVHIK